MMTEEGCVLSVDEDGLWVETQQSSACGQCAARKGCGQSFLAKSLMAKMTSVKAYFGSSNKRIWKPGDRVVIGIEESALLKATLISYFIPLCMLLLGAWLGSAFGDGDVYGAIGATLGLLLGFAWVRSYSKRVKNKRNYHAIVIE